VWDAISLGIDRIGTGGRRFILAMTDGNDNASRIRVADLTAKARAAGVPVHTVGIGSATSVDVTDLTTVSTATGGTFTLIDSNALQAKLAATLDAIRTGIQFQYGGTLATPAAAGAALTLEVSHGGLTGQASLTAAAAGGN
jgi:hypothetical protein